MTRAQGSPDSIAAGRVGRPHGLDGSFYVTRPRARLLALGGRVTVAGRVHTIERRAGTHERPIVRLDGIEDRDGALALRGEQLDVAAEEAPSLGEGEYWAHELEGCAVLGAGRLVGAVTALVELPSCEALEVEPDGGGPTLLVPMVKDAIVRIDVGAREIEVSLDFLDQQPTGRRTVGSSVEPGPEGR